MLQKTKVSPQPRRAASIIAAAVLLIAAVLIVKYGGHVDWQTQHMR